jgi:hypothetical protein
MYSQKGAGLPPACLDSGSICIKQINHAPGCLDCALGCFSNPFEEKRKPAFPIALLTNNFE